MDFLESSSVLVPALTGMALTIYGGGSDTLSQFEDQNCFSPQLQKIYTVKGLESFLRQAAGERLYDLEEPMGTRLAAFKAGETWVLLGPYVEAGWNERAARLLLMRLGASEAVLPMYKAYRCKLPIIGPDFALKTAFLLSENLGGQAVTVETFRMEPEEKQGALTFSGLYANGEEVNLRYQLEDRFLEAISRGDAKQAHRVKSAFGKVQSDLRFMSDSMQDKLVGAAIMRTLIRMGAKLGGLSPVLIDSVSQEYAQQMKETGSGQEMEELTFQMCRRICDEIRKRKRRGWSPSVQRAADYMELNVSRPMTTEEIARAAGEKKRSLVNRFLQETGMTIKEYLAKTRCAIAAQLLAGSDASIQEIGAYVGYLDNNYFSKVFKTHWGMSPQSYRNIHKT